MLTQKDAKTMAKSLRNALGNRNVQLSHSECLEIVARQFGLADWNTLLSKLPGEDERHAQPQTPESTLLPTTQTGTSSPVIETETAQTIQTPAPWTTCSFCGKSKPEVQILMGGCGGWEGFRARRNPESGERSNVFICNECITLMSHILTRNAGIAKGSHEI